MSETIRTFIAIELNKEIQKELNLVQEKLKETDPDVKWLNLSNIHLTLKFLGNIDPSQIEKIKTALNRIGEKTVSFILAFSKIGAFPKIDYPRVIWVGVSEGVEEVIRVNEVLEKALEELGFAREARPFHPHLTLGRVRSGKAKEKLKNSIQSTPFTSQNKINVQKITLFRSELTPKGPLYSVLHEATLSAT